MNILISGKNGFIGSAIANKYEKEGHQVIGIPRELLLLPRRLENYIDAYEPKVIIHCAAYGNMANQKDVDETFNTNVVKTYNLIKSANSSNYNALLLIGSSSEYGKKDKHMSESDILETDTFYGATKAAATQLARAFAVQNRKNIIVVRPFSVYGPGEADFRLIPTAVRARVENSQMKLAIYPKHDWIYIDDFVSGIDTVIQHARELRGKVINVGSGNQVTNGELVKQLWNTQELYNTQILDDYNDLRGFDTDYWVADNTKLKSLGWEQKVSLKDGLRLTYEHYERKFA